MPTLFLCLVLLSIFIYLAHFNPFREGCCPGRGVEASIWPIHYRRNRRLNRRLARVSVLHNSRLRWANSCANVFTLDLLLTSPQDVTIRLARLKMVFLWPVQRTIVISEAFFSMLNLVHPSIGSTKTWNPKSRNGDGNGNGVMESWKREQKRKRNTESNINDRKLKNFMLHNLVQSKENLFQFSWQFP